MTIRTLNSTLKNSLMNYDPFIVAHLIRFEKPQSVSQYGGKLKGLATDYTYITDAQYDIEYDDPAHLTTEGGNIPPQLYRSNKVVKLGTINESIQAKAANMSLTLDSASLGTQEASTCTFTSSKLVGDTDLSAAGFQEGDKVLLTALTSGTNSGAYIRIDGFENGGKTISFTQISSITADSTARPYRITLAAEELNILLADKTSSSYTSYINREVVIHRVHINPDTRAIIGEPYLYFKGITSGAAITEKLDSSQITWTLSSHWGDFIRVQGRMTDDATHRALRADGSPDRDSTIKPEYAGDLGFLHSNTAINHIATYSTTEIEYKQVDINGGWPGGKRLREIEIEVPRQVDLQFNIQAKMLPVVYGVRKIDSFPVFVDTNKNNSAEVYRADALCEGPIAGVLDVYLEDNSTICLDKADFDSRATSGANYNADSVEIICAGRMDRGDTLAHYSANTGSNLQYANSFIENDYDYTVYEENIAAYRDVTYNSTATGTTQSNTGDATGILHEGTHSITSPLTASFTFHSGLPNQQANNTLVSLAANNTFKVQSDYYTGKNQYWGPSHRLLDTAYVVGKYTIAEGETTLPDMKFVVRGRDPECFNYDGSYKHDDSYTENHSNFALGDTVTLKKVNGNMSDTSVQIIDKWSTFDADGNRDHRFRFSPAPSLGTTTAFYMEASGGQDWHMQTWDHAEDSDNVGGNLYASTSSVAAGTTVGRKITLSSPSSAFEAAIGHSDAVAGVYSSSNSGLVASNYSDFSYNSSTNIVDNITRFSSDPGIARVYAKNAIQLGSGASSVNDYYNGNKITVTNNAGDAPYIQERKVIDYIGASRVAIVDAPWDYNYLPTTSDTYSIGSIGDRRVTLNPAMQLLDYMTNKRYGKGLDIDADINLDAWKTAGAECDTRSEVSVLAPSSATIADGGVYRYPQSGTLQFQGTVKSVTTRGSYKEVVFKDVIGKLGKKWNSWEVMDSGQIYWHTNGEIYAGAGSVVSTAPTSNGLSSLSLYRVGASGSFALNLSLKAANGNPLVKKYSDVTGTYTASGYSLYDADDVKYWRYVGWDDNSQRNVTRHQMNQVVDTKLPLFDNINKMLNQFNGILRYSLGKYELEVKSKKGTVDTAEQISNDDIIGTIKLSDKGLKNSKNYVSTSIIDPNNKFEGRSISFFNSTYLKEDKGVQKKGQFSLPGITNYFNARFNIKQYLDESRYGLTIQFTMAPRGLILTAGSIIEFTYPRFGYTSKAFRITNLNFKMDGTVDVTADEHNDDAYVIEEGGYGAGVIEEPGSGQAPEPLPIPARPTNLQCTQTNQGEVVLTWTNTSAFSSATHTVEIYRGTVNDFTDSSVDLIGTSFTDTYNDPISTGSGLTTRYYWIRYMVKTPQLNLAGSEYRNVASLFYPNTDDSGFANGEGITGVGLSVNAVRTVKLNPGTTTNFVYNNAETGIASGYTATTTLTTTVTNNVNTPTYVWKKDGVVISGATSSSYTYTPPSGSGAFDNMPQVISVHITDTVGSETFTAEDFVTMTATKIVVNGTNGVDGFTISATNGTHNFSAPANGTIASVSGFSSEFTVRKGAQALTFDGTSPYSANTFRLGSFANISPANSVVPVNTNGVITIDSSTGNFLTGTSVVQATFDISIIENSSGATIGTFRFVLTKTLSGTIGNDGVRAGGVFTFEENTNGNINATTAAAYAGTLTDAAAQAVAAAVIASAADSAIRPNDKITVTDNSANEAGTRVYTGSGQTSSASVGAADFSSLVVETFDGSVIVDGTLSAGKLAADTTVTNNLTVGSNMILNNSGKFYTSNKTSYTDNDAGFFLGYDTNAHKLNLGDATNYMKWDGSTLNVAGTIALNSSSSVGGTSATTVATAHQTAGGASSGNSRAFMNSNGLVVVDGSGTKRVKIGNLGSL